MEADQSNSNGGFVGALSGTVEHSRATGSAKGRITRASSSSGPVSGGRFARLGGFVYGSFRDIYGQSPTGRIDVTAGYDKIYGPLISLEYRYIKP